MAVTDSDEVLVASTASAAATRLQLGEQPALDVESLHHRLDDQPGPGEVVERGDGDDPGGDGVGTGAVEATLRHRPVEAPPQFGERPVDGPRRGVVEEGAVAGGGGHLGDPGSHRPGAEHPDGDALEGLALRTAHRPPNRGGRFSMNAATPSA